LRLTTVKYNTRGAWRSVMLAAATVSQFSF
jgi:hypothetical protein